MKIEKEKVLEWLKANDKDLATTIVSGLIAGVTCYAGFKRGQLNQANCDSRLIWSFKDKDVKSLIEHLIDLNYS